jgi:hypothetical protein
VAQPLTIDVASVIASPVVLPESVSRVDLNVTDSGDSTSALSISLDGTTWVPVPRGQPISFDREDAASLQVRSVNSKGEIRQVVQNVVTDSSSGSSGVTDTDSSDEGGSLAIVWIVALVIVILIMVVVVMRGRRAKAKD